jgi:mono/diheme cytochrome c family protein
MGRFLFLALLALLLAGGVTFWATRPQPLPAGTMAGFEGDASNGRQVFLAAGCVSCHADAGAEFQEAPLLSGGRRLASDWGTFVPPNISPDPTHGIGQMDLDGFASVLLRGVGSDDRHLYPAMPYGAYARMQRQDIADLKAYLDGLPADSTPRAANELSFPYGLRFGLGLWKAGNLNTAFVGAAPSEQIERGRYLVEALGHCAECHTPRTRFGGLDRSRWMAGAPALSGRGSVPNITPGALDWSREELVYYLERGFTPDHDEVGREMQSVIAGLGQLPREDLNAIAAYLAGLAPIR